MAEREIIREFLTRLGFQVDEPSLKRFVGAMGDTCKLAAKAGAGLVGVATAAEAMTIAFARGMERIYYASQRTGATVTNLRAMEFGFGQIGLTAEDARSAIESMTAAMRTQPGLKGMLASFGIEPNQDPTKLWKTLMRHLGKLPYQIGYQWAEMFGTPESMFRMITLTGALDKLEEAEKRHKQIYRDLGVDEEEAGKQSVVYMNTLKELWTIVEGVNAAFTMKLLPYFKTFTGAVKEWAGDIIKIDFSEIDIDLILLGGFIDEQISSWGKWGKAIGAVIEQMIILPRRINNMLNSDARFWNWLIGPGENRTFDVNPPARERAGQIGGLSYGPIHRTTELERARASLEILQSEQYERPLDASLVREIVRAQAAIDALSASRMPPAIPMYTSTTGAGSQMMTGGITFNQETNIVVSGGDAAATARAVASEQGRVNGDIIRNFKLRTQ